MPPPKCTPALIEVIAADVERGLSHKRACAGRVHECTFATWLRKGREGIEPYAECLRRIQGAERRRTGGGTALDAWIAAQESPCVDELIAAIADDVRAGLPVSRAIRGRVDPSTWQKWCEWADEGRAPYRQAMERIATAEREHELEATKCVTKGEREWRAGAWWLERAERHAARGETSGAAAVVVTVVRFGDDDEGAGGFEGAERDGSPPAG